MTNPVPLSLSTIYTTEKEIHSVVLYNNSKNSVLVLRRILSLCHQVVQKDLCYISPLCCGCGCTSILGWSDLAPVGDFRKRALCCRSGIFSRVKFQKRQIWPRARQSFPFKKNHRNP